MVLYECLDCNMLLCEESELRRGPAGEIVCHAGCRSGSRCRIVSVDFMPLFAS